MDASNPYRVDMSGPSGPGGCKVWAASGSRPLLGRSLDLVSLPGNLGRIVGRLTKSKDPPSSFLLIEIWRP